MKLTEFFKISDKKNNQENVVSPPETADSESNLNSSESGADINNGEKTLENNLENTEEINVNQTDQIGTNQSKKDPQSINDLLNDLQNVGKQLQQPGQPDITDIPNAIKNEEKKLQPPTGKNVRDAKALVEINDWGLGFGLSKYAKEPSENISDAMEPYQASDDEKEDLTADLAELLQDSGIELPPGLKFAFTYLRIYGPKAFLSHMNRRLNIKMEREFERQKAQMKDDLDKMKKEFREELEKEYKGKTRKNKIQEEQEEDFEEDEFEEEEIEDEEDENPEFESTSTEDDGSIVMEPKKVAKSYDQFRVKTDWDEPDTPPNLKNAPYAVSLQGLIYEMIAELRRGEKIILDLLRDGFTQDTKPITSVIAIPEKGTNGRKSSYERALLEMILQIQRELKETQKKISIIKNSL